MTSAVPDIPQDVSAFEVTLPSSGDNCIIVVNWNPPINANISLVKRYTVESSSVIFHCQVELNAEIEIRAIDSCGRGGASSSDNIIAIVDVLETANSSKSVTTDQPSTTDEQRWLNLCLLQSC